MWHGFGAEPPLPRRVFDHFSPSAVNSEWIGPFFDPKHPPTRQLACEGKFVSPPKRKRTLTPSHAYGVYNTGRDKGAGRWEAGGVRGGGGQGTQVAPQSNVNKTLSTKISHCIWGSGGRANVTRVVVRKRGPALARFRRGVGNHRRKGTSTDQPPATRHAGLLASGDRRPHAKKKRLTVSVLGLGSASLPGSCPKEHRNGSTM